MKILPALLALLILNACAPAWEKPGASADERSLAEKDCTQQAEDMYPPVTHQVMRHQAYTTTNKNACFGSRNLTDCLNTQDIFVPPQMEMVDDNAAARNKGLRTCMQDKGWQLTQ